MKNLILLLFLLLLSTSFLNSAITRAPEDYMGRIPIPSSIEINVLKFKTDQIVYAGTNGSGIYVSYDVGSNWVKLKGFPIQNPCVKDIFITLNKELYAATFGGGVYYSNDNGATWIPKNNGLKNLFVQAITVTGLGKVVCGTYGGGIYYSDDNGDNWTRTDRGLRNDNITCLITMKNGRILAGTLGGGVYASRDTCKSWVLSNTELENLFINSFSEDESGKIYAATNGAGVMFSGDGMSWNKYPNKYHLYMSNKLIPLLDTAVVAVAVNKYQMLMGTRSAGMYFWDDIYNSWENTGDLTVGMTASAVSPNGTILAARSYSEFIRSTDNGLSWIICSQNVENFHISEYSNSPDFLNVFAGKYENSLVSVANMGTSQQISISKDHGNTWKYLNSINTTKIFDIEITPDTTIYVADEDGIHRFSESTGMFELICTDPDEDSKIWRFLEVDYNSVTKTIFAIYELAEPVKPPKIPPPNWERVEYKIYKSLDNGKFWSIPKEIKVGEPNANINSLTCKSNGDIFVNIASSFCKSTDNGNNFDPLFSNMYKILYGANGSLYYYDLTNMIFYKENETDNWYPLKFDPKLIDPEGTWRIQCIGSDLDGNFYVSIVIRIPGLVMYEVYMTKDLGVNWQTMKGCYNMDNTRKIVSDDNGYAFFLTNALYKVLNPIALKTPIILSPMDGKKGEEINPLMSWNTVRLAEEYELQFDQLEDFTDPFEINVTGDSNCQVILNLFSGYDFYWRLRAKTHSARSKWSETRTITIGLEGPILVSPSKGKSGVPLNVDLIWHPIQNAINYLIQVAEDESFNKIVFEQDNYQDTTVKSGRLIGLKTYYWRVKGFTKDNVSRFSEVWNFRTVMGPPQLVYPENNSNDRLLSEEFKWRKSTEAESYYIQVAKDSSCSDILFEGSVVTDTTKLIDSMLPETEYFWRVASINTFGTSEYSDVWRFNTSLRAVSLRTPENKKVNFQKDDKFTWLEHNAGSQYQIQISKNSDFKSIVEDQKVNNLLEFNTTKLDYYKLYYWRVRLVVGQRTGLWSDIWTFKTGIQTADLLNPPDKSKDQPNTIKFKWYEVAGAKFYQLQISKNEQFTDMVYSMDSLTKSEQNIEKLEPEVLYYWRARAWNDESYGTAQWSDIWTFTTGEETLILSNPKSGSKDINIPILLTWFPATSSDIYHLQVSQDANFANIIFNKDTIYDTRFTLSKLDIVVNQTYYWRVKGVGKNYTTPWSETWNFKTASVSVEESDKLRSIKLYPNPTGSGAELSINFTETCNAILTITTAKGKLVNSEPIRLTLGETRYNIDTENLVTGSYFISIITSSGVITRELVVLK